MAFRSLFLVTLLLWDSAALRVVEEVPTQTPPPSADTVPTVASTPSPPPSADAVPTAPKNSSNGGGGGGSQKAQEEKIDDGSGGPPKKGSNKF